MTDGMNPRQRNKVMKTLREAGKLPPRPAAERSLRGGITRSERARLTAERPATKREAALWFNADDYRGSSPDWKERLGLAMLEAFPDYDWMQHSDTADRFHMARLRLVNEAADLFWTAAREDVGGRALTASEIRLYERKGGWHLGKRLLRRYRAMQDKAIELDRLEAAHRAAAEQLLHEDQLRGPDGDRSQDEGARA